MDFITQLGALTLDHRFKRLMQQLLEEAEAVYRALDLPIRPRWVSALLLLEGHGPLSVTDIAKRLRVTHPGIIQLLREMGEAGMVTLAQDASDGRRRQASLTSTGQNLMPVLRGVWKVLAEVQEELFRAAGCDIVPLLEHIDVVLLPGAVATAVLARLETQQERVRAVPRARKREQQES
jgi:DNA-binding MarR family transcriptional regulator